MSFVPQDRTLAQQLSGAFMLFGALVAVAFFLTALAYGVGRVWLTPEFERSRLAASTESAAYAAMLDEENGLRAYLLTHDVRFMDPYARGEVDLARANQALTGYVGSVPELAAAMLGTRLAEERWRERWAKAAADMRPGAANPSMSEGKALFDGYRSEEAAFAEALNRRREALSRREQQLIAGRVVLELLVFVAVLYLAVRQHRALHEAIVAPVATPRPRAEGSTRSRAVASASHPASAFATAASRSCSLNQRG